jgi:hypothetical protein
MKKNFISAILITLSAIASCQVGLGYYLPQSISYNSKIPAPKQFFGHEIGEWHLTHDKLYYYMLELASASDRAVWEEYGRTYENRPLGHLIISSPENIKNLDQIRKQHLMLCDPLESDKADISTMPVVIMLG